MSHSMSGYTSGSSRNESTNSGLPPSYEEFQKQRLSVRSNDKVQLISDSDDNHQERRNRPTKNTSIRSNNSSISSEPMKLTGLSYAFSSSALANTTVINQNNEVPANGTDALYPLGDNRYQQQPGKEPIKVDVTELHENRDAWGSKIEFILASVGLAVGLGNVWRFPYLCQQNGGGAFLIPYVIMMVIEGIPLFFIEYAIGQRFRRSAPNAWAKIHPALKGIGISCIIISFLLCIYYISIIAWSFFYFFISLAKELPWRLQDCPMYNQYKGLSDQCSSNVTGRELFCAEKEKLGDCCLKDPQLYYFYRKTLDVSTNIEDNGNGFNGKLFGCLVLAWVLVYACIVKGVKSSGKAVYFTATFPYIILIILFFVGVTLDGAGEGLKTLFTPDFSKLKEPKIWMDAASQMFFTLSLGFGALISFSSYMPLKNNCIRDAYTVVMINCGTSIFAGIVVFSILGHRELVTGNPASEVGSGPGLAFITFCDAFLQMPVSPLWSALFFIMLILLGIDSEFGTLEAMIAPFYDMKWVKMRKEIFTALCAVIMLLIGMSLTQSSGYYVFQLFDDFSIGLPLLFIAFFQVISVSWIYGNDKFGNDIEFMTGSRPNIFWMICWKYISPLAIFIIFVANVVNMASVSPKYSAYVGCLENPFSTLYPGVKGSMMKIQYPGWGHFIAVVFVLISMVPIILWLGYDLIQNPSEWVAGFQKRFGSLIEFHPDPALVDQSRRKIHEIEGEIMRELENERC